MSSWDIARVVDFHWNPLTMLTQSRKGNSSSEDEGTVLARLEVRSQINDTVEKIPQFPRTRPEKSFTQSTVFPSDASKTFVNNGKYYFSLGTKHLTNVKIYDDCGSTESKLDKLSSAFDVDPFQHVMHIKMNEFTYSKETPSMTQQRHSPHHASLTWTSLVSTAGDVICT